MKFGIGASLVPFKLDEDVFEIGDNRRLYIRSTVPDECTEIQFDNGPRITVKTRELINAVTRCSSLFRIKDPD